MLTVDKAIEKIRHSFGPEKYVILHGEKIAFVELAYDSNASNPLEDWDETGTIHSFNRRHTNFIDPTSEQFEALQAEHGADLIPLSYYEHGQCLWFVVGSDTPAGVEFQWDGTRFAGVWVPDAGLKGYADDENEPLGSPERIARMSEYAKQACTTYTDYCNGSVYGYSIEVYNVRRDEAGTVWDDEYDYRRETATDEDSCWGFYGWDYFKEEVIDRLCATLGIEQPVLPGNSAVAS